MPGLFVTDERYSRHHMPGWEQDRLAEATAIILGVGALGNEVAQCLALAGTGTLILCDPDRVERSNLSRAPLYRERDVGRLKVEAAADALADLAPTVQVKARPHRLETGVGLAELRDAAVVLGCLDSRAARLELAGRCGLVRAPWIDGATGAWSGEIRPFLDPNGPCYGCGQDDAARATTDTARHCGEQEAAPAAAAAPVSAAIGAQMALVAVRFLMGLETPRGLVIFDGVSTTTTLVRQQRDASCPYHREITSVSPLDISPRDRVRDLLAALGPERTPLAWHPVPVSGSVPWVRSTLELTQAPPEATLAEIGVPPREILAFRSPDGIGFVELDE